MNELLRIVLVDDESAVRSISKNYLQNIKNVLVVGEAKTAEEAEEVIKKTQPNLVLLDIHLGNSTGFDLLRKFSQPNFKVIFITAYEKYALNALKAGALDFLLKPIDEDEFVEAIGKAKTSLSYTFPLIEIADSGLKNKEIDRLVINSNEGYQIIWVKDIMYCVSSGNYTTFYLENAKNIVSSKAMKEYENILPDFFIRSHQSYLVNMNFVEKYTKDQILVLKNQTEIMVASRKKDEIIRWFKNYSS